MNGGREPGDEREYEMTPTAARFEGFMTDKGAPPRPPKKPTVTERLLDAVSIFPMYFKAVLFEPVTTVRTSVSSADAFSGVIMLLLALVMQLIGFAVLGGAAGRAMEAPRGGMVYVALAMAHTLTFSRLMTAWLLYVFASCAALLVSLCVIKRVRLTPAVISTALGMPAAPFCFGGALSLVFGLISAALCYLLQFACLIWSLFLCSAALSALSGGEEDGAAVGQYRLMAATALVWGALVLLLV